MKETKTRNEAERKDFGKKYMGKALAFIRTRVSEDKVADMKDTMGMIAEELDLRLLDTIIDRSGRKDIDREALDLLYGWFEEEEIHLLILNSIADITDDPDDLDCFMQDMNENNVIMLCLRDQNILMPDAAGFPDDMEDFFRNGGAGC